MLQSLRKSAGSWIVKAFLLVLAASFGIGVWGVGGSILRGPRSTLVASVGDVEITSLDFDRAFRDELNILRARFGSIDADQARALGLVDLALDNLVTRTLYDLDADRLRLAISDEVVRGAIVADPAFQNSAGAFDRAVFGAALARIGLSEDQFVEELRARLARGQLAGTLAAVETVPKALLDALYRFRNERRVAEFVVIANGAIDDVSGPDEAALAAYHREHPERFTAPEYRQLTFVTLEPKDLADEIVIPEEDLRAEYEDRSVNFFRPERREVEQILFASEDRAAEAKGLFARGVPFAEVAERVTGAGADRLALGMIERADLSYLSEEAADAVFSLPEGSVSEPVESPLGWHLFRVLRIAPAETLPFEEVREGLRQELALQEAVDAVYRLANDLEDTLAAGATLEEAARQVRLKLTRIEAVDAEGKTPEGLPAAGLATAANFLETAFATELGMESMLTETEKGGYFMVRVDRVTPAAVRSLDEVRNEVAAAWLAAERARTAAVRAKDAAAQVSAGAELTAVAREFGAAVRVSAAVDRLGGGGDSVLTPQLVAEMFRRRPGEAFAGPTALGDGQVVVRVKTFITADPLADPEGVKRLNGSLAADIAADIAEQYSQILRQRFPVHINQRMVDALF
ncbi:MAG: SurA N-terminal domain-containing protein [Alphaproteobacteria bacterium]